MSDDLSRRLEQVAEAIPATPRGFGALRQMLRTLPALTPTSLPGTSGALLPDTGQQATSEEQGSPTASALGGGTPGTVGAGSVVPGSLPVTSLASSIVVPRIVSVLPALPNAAYPQGTLVFYTVDEKLYRNTDGSTWSRAVDGADLIADSVIAGKLAAAAVGAREIAANAITVASRASKGANLLDDPSFEIEPVVGFNALFTAGTDARPYWRDASPGCVMYQTHGNARTGTHVARVQGNGGNWPSIVSDFIPVVPGQTYRLAGWMATGGVGTVGRLRVTTYDAAQAVVTNAAAGINTSTAANTYYQATWTCPTDGSVTYVRIFCYIELPTPALAANAVTFEDIEFVEAAANVRNSDGNVTIDSSGITIQNGKLTFIDAFGTTAMDGGGFGQSWVKFIANRVYNGDFAAGLTSGDIGVSEVGGGSGLANYLASLSANLPYWVVASSGGDLRLVADAAASSGFAIRFSGASGTTRIYQDIPVVPGRLYEIFKSWRYVNSGADFALSEYFSWRKADHSLIGSRVGGGTAFPGSTSGFIQSSGHVGISLGYTGAPANAAFLRFEIEITHQVANSNVYFSEVQLREYSFSRFAVVGGGARYATQAIPANTWTAIQLTSDFFDALGFHNPVTNNTRILIPAGYDFGLWRIWAAVTFALSTAGTRRIIGVRQNSSGTAAPVSKDERTFVTGGNNFDIHAQQEWRKQLGPGDYIELVVHQNTAGNLDIKDAEILLELGGLSP